MSGFLRHLAQRSMTASGDVRPRPVSLFESSQPLKDFDSPPDALFAVEQGSITGEADPAERGAFELVAHLHGASSPAASPTHAELRLDAAEAAPVSDRRMNRRDGGLEDKADLQGANSSTDDARLEMEPMQRSIVTGASRHPERAGSRSQGRLEPAVPQRPAGETPIQELRERNPFDAAATLYARPLHVEGRRAAQPPPTNAKASAEPSSSEQEPPITQAHSDPNSGRESPQRLQVDDPDVRTDASSRDLLRKASRDEALHRTLAFLTPRLRQPGSVAQPWQISTEKAPEPVVHVTIGRVEIRAVSATAQPKRAAQSKPALSLSDYLQRRSGGRA